MQPTTQPSILVVDDEPNNFITIKTLLFNQPYTLLYASSGVQALEELDAFEPDIILLDVMMPDLDGIEVCKRLKASPQWQTVPVIMVTALSTKEDLARCLEAGADDFISKPVSRLELHARVRSMLRIKQQYDHIQSLLNIQRETVTFLEKNLQELRHNLAYSLTHELNTPLNGILGPLDFVVEEVRRMNLGSTMIHEFLDIARQSARRLDNLVQKFFNYFRLELAKLPPAASQGEPQADRKSSSSSTTVREMAKVVAEQMERKQDLRCQIDDVDLAIATQHLQWIVSELVENAFKFSEPETPVSIKGLCRDDQFHVWIQDLGRGMTAEQIANVGAFMQFERSTYEQQGTGLGLKIAQKAVELYGGSLAISSVYHQGTTIHLTLPMASHTVQ